MLIRIGSQKYHLYVAFLEYYDEKGKQFNLFELGVTPWFHFVIYLIPLELYVGFKKCVLLWIRKGEIIFNDKFILRRSK